MRRISGGQLATRLGRTTSSGRFVPEIDGLRFLAIALVVLCHTPFHKQPNAPLAYAAFCNHASFGVQIFFLISGFILAVPFAEASLYRTREVDLRRYFLRRITRIEPPYLINLALWFILKVLFLGRTVSWLLPHLLASMAYTHNAIYKVPSEVNLFAWSLEIEVQFYVVAPLLALVFRLPRTARLSLLAVAIIAGTLVAPGLSLATQSQWFLTGFVLADIYLVAWNREPTTHSGWDVIGAAAWALVFFLLIGGDRGNLTGLACHTAVPGVLLVAVASTFRGPLLRRVLRWTPIYVTGGMCYTIYLYHGYVLDTVIALQKRYAVTGHFWVDTLVGLAVGGAGVFAFCALMFVLFEKPFMNPRWYVDLGFSRWPSRLPERSPRGLLEHRPQQTVARAPIDR